MFSTYVLRQIYASPAIKHELFDTTQDEIPQWELKYSISSQGNLKDINDEAADVELKHKKENAVEAVDDEEVNEAPIELDSGKAQVTQCLRRRIRADGDTL